MIWKDLKGLDVLLYYEGNATVRDRFKQSIIKHLYPRIQRDRTLEKLLQYRYLDHDHNPFFKMTCIEVCRKHREQPKQVSQKDWFIYDFCITDRFKMRELPKSRGQILSPMGW